MLFLHSITLCYYCKVLLEWLSSFLPWFLVNAFVFFQVFVATFIAKCTSRCPPEVTFISVHWTCQLCLTATAKSFRTVNENGMLTMNIQVTKLRIDFYVPSHTHLWHSTGRTPACLPVLSRYTNIPILGWDACPCRCGIKTWMIKVNVFGKLIPLYNIHSNFC